jgi:hypothetical protein
LDGAPCLLLEHERTQRHDLAMTDIEHSQLHQIIAAARVDALDAASFSPASSCNCHRGVARCYDHAVEQPVAADGAARFR